MKVTTLTKKLLPGILFSLIIFSSIFFYTGNFRRPEILGISYSITTSDLLSSINEVRRSNGLHNLTLSEKLSTAASEKAQDMLSKNYWSHYSPSGKAPWHFMTKNGYSYAYACENLAKGFTSPQDTFNAWMASDAHRRNILSKSFTDTGFAVVEGNLQGKDVVLVVEMFGSQAQKLSFGRK